MKIEVRYGAGLGFTFNIIGSYNRNKVMSHILSKEYPNDIYTIYKVIKPGLFGKEEIDHFGVWNGKAIDSKKWFEENRKAHDEYKRTHLIECMPKHLTSYEIDFYL